jgi:hypothetical protein
MTEVTAAPCEFCEEPVAFTDARAWRKVTVWVHGPKSNGACMQGSEALAWAHDRCAALERRGISAAQEGMF